MSSSGNKVNWFRPKDHAKRQAQRPLDEDFDLLEHNFQHKEPHMTNKEKADKHLSNLHMLLRNMPSFNGNDNVTRKNFTQFTEKTNTSSTKSNDRYKSNKPD